MEWEIIGNHQHAKKMSKMRVGLSYFCKATPTTELKSGWLSLFLRKSNGLRKVLGIRPKSSIEGFFTVNKRRLIYFKRNVAIFSIKIIHSAGTDNRDVTSLASSTFLCNENPAVKFQAAESCPNGHRLIKWALQLCERSARCGPLQFRRNEWNRE